MTRVNLLLHVCFIEIPVFNANSADPDQMQHCLPVTLLGVSRLKWVKGLSKIVADILILLFIRENKLWYFMRIICYADDSHEMSGLIFSEKKKYEKEKPKFLSLQL